MGFGRTLAGSFWPATAARLASISTGTWKNLAELWGVSVPWEQPGVLWISKDSAGDAPNPWHQLELSMRENGIDFHAIDRNEAGQLTDEKLRLDPDELYFHETEVLQLEVSGFLHTMQMAVRKNAVEVMEHTQVEGFKSDGQGLISAAKYRTKT
jgi:hypothetical protein